MARSNYISDDFASKLERARRMVQRAPQPHRMPSPAPPSAPIVSGMFRVYNNASETIPEFAVMQVEDLTNRSGFTGTSEDAYSVVQPGNGGDNKDEMGTMFLVNAGGEIKQGHFGAGIFLAEPGKVLIDPDADPEFLDSFGPVEDEWHLGPTGVGYLWLGLTDEEEGTAIFREGIPPDGVLFRNDASETMPAHGVGRITGDIDVEGKGDVTKVTKPDTTWSRDWLVNGSKDVEAGAYGFGRLHSAGKKLAVLYDTGTPAYGEGWGPKPSQWSLSKGYYGFDVFGNNDTTALTTIAKGKPIETLFGKLAGGTLAVGGTQTANIWAGDGGSEAVTSFTAITVRDWFMKSGATAIANGKKIKIEWRLNAYYATLTECA